MFKVFKNGNEIIKRHKIKFISLTKQASYWQVGGVDISLKNSRYGKELNCTCKGCSLHYNRFVCCYKAALVAYLTAHSENIMVGLKTE